MLIGSMVGEYGDISYRRGFFYGFITGILSFTTGILTTTLFLKVFISK